MDLTPKQTLDIDFRSLGSTGLRQYGGFLQEEFLRELSGQSGMRVYREMGDNDPTCGGILYTMDKIVRRVPWTVEPASSAPQDRAAAEHLESCMDDMRNTWIDTISEIMTMTQFGFCLNEIIYKRRCGDADEKSRRSKYSDGRTGWRDLAIRSQDTIFRWVFDSTGDVVGAQQMAPPGYRLTFLPMSKCLLFRTQVHKGNPEGRSIFRSAYRPWYKKQGIENYESIGVERDLAGIPVGYAPPEVMATSASPEQKALYGFMQDICANIRNNQQATIILPNVFDDKNNRIFDIKLMSAGGARQFDTDKIIQRYDQRIAMSMLADFLLMGQSSSSTGSFAMHSDKTKIFALALGSFLDIIQAVFNDRAIPELFALNTFNITDHPRLEHGKIEQVDLKELSDYITALAGAGMPLFPNAELERYLCDVASLPQPLDAEAAGPDQQVETAPKEDRDTDFRELHDDSSMEHVDAAPEARSPSSVTPVSAGGNGVYDRIARASLMGR